MKYIQGVSKKTSFCQNWPWQILLLTVRNPYETFANTSKTPSPFLTTSKCVSTCNELIVDFSLSTVIFALANFDKGKFFLRHLIFSLYIAYPLYICVPLR